MKKTFKIEIEVEQEDFCFSDLKESIFDGVDNIGNHKIINITEALE